MTTGIDYKNDHILLSSFYTHLFAMWLWHSSVKRWKLLPLNLSLAIWLNFAHGTLVNTMQVEVLKELVHWDLPNLRDFGTPATTTVAHCWPTAWWEIHGIFTPLSQLTVSSGSQHQLPNMQVHPRPTSTQLTF